MSPPLEGGDDGEGKRELYSPSPYPLLSRKKEIWCGFEHSNFESACPVK